jgi:hypothetical protein
MPIEYPKREKFPKKNLDGTTTTRAPAAAAAAETAAAEDGIIKSREDAEIQMR